MRYCEVCGDEVDTYIDDTSFDHEFGVHLQYDIKCKECDNILEACNGRPPEEPYDAEEL